MKKNIADRGNPTTRLRLSPSHARHFTFAQGGSVLRGKGKDPDQWFALHASDLLSAPMTQQAFDPIPSHPIPLLSLSLIRAPLKRPSDGCEGRKSETFFYRCVLFYFTFLYLTVFVRS